MTQIAALAAHPRNYNRHSAGQVADLARSLTRFGQRKPVVTWHGVILAGHGLVEAARSLGWSEIWTAEAPEEWTEAEALAFVAADNELARAADPDVDALAALVAEVGDVDAELARLAAGGEEALKRLLASIQQPAGEDPGAQIDKAEELRVKWQVETGQLWALGEHRLICGDCTDAAVVARVMGGEKAQACVTDPPYGINREGVANDDPEGLRALFDGCLAAMPITDGVLIAFQSPRLFPVWLDATRDAIWAFERALWFYDETDVTFPWRGWLMTSQIALVSSIGKAAWNKSAPYHHDCYIVKTAGKQDDSGGHTTAKPLDVVEDLAAHTTGLVFEPFSGSGTTLIACERLGRRCRAVEISPGYVAVALERWATMTGRTPVLEGVDG